MELKELEQGHTHETSEGQQLPKKKKREDPMKPEKLSAEVKKKLRCQLVINGMIMAPFSLSANSIEELGSELRKKHPEEL